MRELKEVPLVEEPELHMAGGDQVAQCLRLEGRDPVGPLKRLQRGDLGLRDHPAVPHHHQPLDPKPLADPLDLRQQRRRIGGIPLEDGHRHRTAPPLGEQPVVDLAFALLAVAIVAEGGQGAGGALEITRAQVIEHEAPGRQMARGQLLLDPVLAGEHPIHRLIQRVLVGVAHAEIRGQRGGVPPAGRGQLAVGLEDPGHDHGDDELALPRGARRDERVEAQPLHGEPDRLHVAVVGGGDDLEQRVGGREGLIAEHSAQEVNLLGRPLGQIGQGAVLDRAALAVALPQQNGRGRAAIRHDGDIHANTSTPIIRFCQAIICPHQPSYMSTLCFRRPQQCAYLA